MDKNILYRFFAGEATQKEKHTLKNWLEEDESNKKELMKERDFFNAIILSDNQKGKLQSKKKVFRIPSVIVETLKIAAIIAIVITGSTLFYTQKMNRIQQAINLVNVPSGQRVNVVLPDGTNVWLNAGTRFKYPAYFSGSKREVQLDGEAFFEVKHNKEEPFIVRTNKCNVEVLGTKFNVEAYNNSTSFSTALLEGSVKISNNTNTEDVHILQPNSQAVLHNGLLNVSPIVDYDYYRWQEGLICFKNMEFAELMTRFEKCYDVKIIIENKKISGTVFNGKFRISDGIDNALRILQKDAKYTYEKTDDGTVIYIR